MRLFFKIFLLSAFVFTFLSCEKRNIRTATYLETQCTDPWGNASSRNETTQLVKNYFADKGAIIIDVSFSSADVLICEACGCYSGREISVTIDKEEVDILIDHGFTLEEDD